MIGADLNTGLGIDEHGEKWLGEKGECVGNHDLCKANAVGAGWKEFMLTYNLFAANTFVQLDQRTSDLKGSNRA